MADDRAQPPTSPLSQTSLHPFAPSDGHHRRSIVIETPRSPVRRRESAFSQQPMSPVRRIHPPHRRSMSPARPRSMSIALGIKRDNSMLPELPHPTLVQGLRSLVNASWFNILLVFVPISWSFEYALRPRTSAHQAAIFITSFLAIISLATFRSWAVGELTVRVGKTLGALIATCFGNVVPFIVGVVSLQQCNLTAVRNSLVGSILSNLLLILGMCFFAAGRPKLSLSSGEVPFQESMTNVSTTLLLLSVSAILIPGSFHWVLKSDARFTAEELLAKDLSLSRGVAVILILLYFASLAFQFISHKHMFDSPEADGNDIVQRDQLPYPENKNNFRPRLSSKHVQASMLPPDGPDYPLRRTTSPEADLKTPVHEESLSIIATPSPPQLGRAPRFRRSVEARIQGLDVERQASIQAVLNGDDARKGPDVPVPTAPLWLAVVVLIIVTGIVANNVRFLINSINGLTDLTSGHMQHSWVALILLPIAGNVADHVMTVTHTFRDDLDLAIALAFGASVQMALGVIPFLVLVAWAVGKPLTLLWDPFQGIILLLTTLNVSWVVSDGKVNWLEGMILMALYLLVAVAFWWYPDSILPIANCT